MSTVWFCLLHDHLQQHLLLDCGKRGALPRRGVSNPALPVEKTHLRRVCQHLHLGAFHPPSQHRLHRALLRPIRDGPAIQERLLRGVHRRSTRDPLARTLGVMHCPLLRSLTYLQLLLYKLHPHPFEAAKHQPAEKAEGDWIGFGNTVGVCALFWTLQRLPCGRLHNQVKPCLERQSSSSQLVQCLFGPDYFLFYFCGC